MSPTGIRQAIGARENPVIKILRLLFLIFVAAVFCLLATVPLNWEQQAILGAVSLVAALALARSSESYLVTLTLMMLSMFCTFRYGYWRISQVIRYFQAPANHGGAWDAFFILCLLLAEGYAFVILFLGYFQTIWPLRRAPVSLPENPDDWPEIDVLITTLNEPLDVVRYTTFGALNMDWPADKLHVYILDDGCRKEFEQFAFEAGIGYRTRSENKFAKAGNINSALQTTSSPLVAVFDCDHVPTRSFLQMTVGWFLRDKRLAVMQTPHHFYSPDPFERNLRQFHIIPNEGELFYGVVQDGNDFWNASFFCGSCAILRRAALDQIGGMATDTVTEDAHTSLRMQMAGWNSAYINIPQAAGLATECLSAHVRQRIRWARGMIQVLSIENPLFAPGLTFAQRLCYFNAVGHFLYAVPRLIFLTSPLVYLLLGRTIIPGYWAAILAYALPHLTLSNVSNSRIQGEHRYSFWNEIYETVLSPYILLPTLMALLSTRLGKFNVTSKSGVVNRTFFNSRIAQPFLVMLLLNFAGLAVAVPRFFIWDTSRRGTVLINVLWCCFNIVILGVCTAVARELQQRRTTVRINVAAPLSLKLPNGKSIACDTVDMSTGGAGIRLNDPLNIAPDTLVHLTFSRSPASLPLHATVVSLEDSVLRVRFDDLSIAEQEALTLALYSRADSWLGWGEGRENDKVLRSLGRIFAISMRGLKDTLFSVFGRDDKPARKPSSLSIVQSGIILLLAAALIAAAPKTAGQSDQSLHPSASLTKPTNSVGAPGLGQHASQPTNSVGAPGLGRHASQPTNSVGAPGLGRHASQPTNSVGAPGLGRHASQPTNSVGAPGLGRHASQPTNSVGAPGPSHLGTGNSPNPSSANSAIPAVLPGQYHDSFTLAALGSPQIELHSIDSRRKIYFSLPQAHVVRSATIHLQYAFSPALIPQLSQLKLILNGTLFATIQPSAGQLENPQPQENAGPLQNSPLNNGADQETDVNIPPALLVRNNTLTTEFIGHYSTGHEDPANTSLWARVDRNSAIDILGDLQPLADDLKQLPIPFVDPAVLQPVSISVAFPSQPSFKAIQAAGIVASYFGLVSENRPARFPVSIGAIPQGNAIVIAENAVSLPAGLNLSTVSGPTVAMRTNPNDPYGKILIVTGASADDAIVSAQAIALNTGMISGAQAPIINLSLPAKQAPDAAPRWARTDQPIHFSDYATASQLQGTQLQSDQMQGDGTAPLNVHFRIPPDLYYDQGSDNARLHLAYRYNPISIGPASSLQARVNDSYLGSAPLFPGPSASDKSDPSATSVPSDTSDILRTTQTDASVPVADLRPFSNTLSFRFAFQLARNQNCDCSTPVNLQGAILPDSYLDLRGYPHWTPLPNLEIFADAGFPFTRIADLSETTVVLPPTPTVQEIETFITLMGHFGRQTGFPGLRVTVAGPDALHDGAATDFLIIGSGDDQPAFGKLATHLPVSLSSGQVQVKIPGPLPGHDIVPSPVHDTWGSLISFLHNTWWKLHPNDHPDSGGLTIGGTPDAVIEGIESPYDIGGNRSIVAIHLKDASTFEPFISTFLTVQQSSDVSGSVSVLHGAEFQSSRVGTQVYHVGVLPWWMQARLWAAEYPWLIAVVVVLLAFLFALCARQALRSKARARLTVLDN